MAIILADRLGSDSQNNTVDFAALWNHYLATGFLYPDKLAQLETVMDSIRAKWPCLLSAPETLFQVHVGQIREQVTSSLSAFRDTDDTYIVQHAASNRQPAKMLGCLHSLVRALTVDSSALFVSYYFPPENSWMAELERNISSFHPTQLRASLVTREQLIYRTDENRPTYRPGAVEIATDATETEIAALIRAAVEPVRASSFGIGRHPLNLETLNRDYQQTGIQRQRQVFAVRRDGVIAGIALCYTSDVPINFSFLCNRVEIFLHPNAPNPATLVSLLCEAAIDHASTCRVPLCSLLIDPLYAEAAAEVGFERTGRRYSNRVWQREPTYGWSVISAGAEYQYSRLVSPHNCA